MVFAKCVRERLTLTLKSGLLCVIMLTPALAWAESPETRLSEKPTLAFAEPETNTEIGSAELKPADQRKATRLSGHIQRRYQVPGHRADRIVWEAVQNGARHQIEPELILAIIAVESTFKERAVSRCGARGLMQVMPGSHPRKMGEIGGSHELFDPAKNIHIGSRILVSYLDDHSGNLRRALLSYNGSLSSHSSFPERVMRIYRDLQRATTEG